MFLCIDIMMPPSWYSYRPCLLLGAPDDFSKCHDNSGKQTASTQPTTMACRLGGNQFTGACRQHRLEFCVVCSTMPPRQRCADGDGLERLLSEYLTDSRKIHYSENFAKGKLDQVRTRKIKPIVEQNPSYHHHYDDDYHYDYHYYYHHHHDLPQLPLAPLLLQ